MPLFRTATIAPRLRTRKRHRTWSQPMLRRVAFACVVLLGAASGRAILPGLCANLAAHTHAFQPVYGADSILAAKRPCCTAATAPHCSPAGGQDRGAPRIPFLVSCAFCTLTATPVEPLERVILPAPGIHGFAPCDFQDVTAPRLREPIPRRGRAPPAPVASSSHLSITDGSAAA